MGKFERRCGGSIVVVLSIPFILLYVAKHNVHDFFESRKARRRKGKTMKAVQPRKTSAGASKASEKNSKNIEMPELNKSVIIPEERKNQFDGYENKRRSSTGAEHHYNNSLKCKLYNWEGAPIDFKGNEIFDPMKRRRRRSTHLVPKKEIQSSPIQEQIQSGKNICYTICSFKTG